MPATSAPFGLRPAFHPSGLDRAIALTDGIVSAYATDILKGQPVKMATTGVLQVAAAGDAFQGAFAGVEWTDTTGRRRVSNYWPANTAYQTGSCVAYYYSDPNIVYEVQAAGTLTQAAIGEEFDLSNTTAGSTTTGLSQATMSITPAGSGNNAQMRVINLAPYADNAWGDDYVIVQAQISKHQYVALSNAI
jgi:hypothetical protein